MALKSMLSQTASVWGQVDTQGRRVVLTGVEHRQMLQIPSRYYQLREVALMSL